MGARGEPVHHSCNPFFLCQDVEACVFDCQLIEDGEGKNLELTPPKDDPLSKGPGGIIPAHLGKQI